MAPTASSAMRSRCTRRGDRPFSTSRRASRSAASSSTRPAEKLAVAKAIRTAVGERLRLGARQGRLSRMARAPKIEEERPPHDALEGVPLPRETTILVGHQAAEQALLDAYRSGRMHHGWILAGRAGDRQGDARLPARALRLRASRPGGAGGRGGARPFRPARASGGAPRRASARTAISCICSATGTRSGNATGPSFGPDGAAHHSVPRHARRARGAGAS